MIKTDKIITYILNKPDRSLVSFGNFLKIGFQTISDPKIFSFISDEFQLLFSIDRAFADRLFKRRLLSYSIVYVNTFKLDQISSFNWLNNQSDIFIRILWDYFFKLQYTYSKNISDIPERTKKDLGSSKLLQILFSMNLDLDSFKEYLLLSLNNPLFIDVLDYSYQKTRKDAFNLDKAIADRIGLSVINPEKWLELHNSEIVESNNFKFKGKKPKKKRDDLKLNRDEDEYVI